jgi:hypothetical protein
MLNLSIAAEMIPPLGYAKAPEKTLPEPPV